MKLDLKYYPNPILRKKTTKIKKITPEIKKLAIDMIETMKKENGVGLAANQVGSLLSILIITDVKIEKGQIVLKEPEVYINPELSNPSKETEKMTEGCLSFPGLHIEIERPISVHVDYLDLEGNKVSKKISGFKARELMHENDHLNGVVFIDRADKETKKLIKPDLKELKKKYKKFA